MNAADRLAVVEIGQRAGNLQHTMIGARRKAELLAGLAKQRHAIGIGPSDVLDDAGRAMGIECLAGETLNAHCAPGVIEDIARPDANGMALLGEASEKLGFSARAYHRVLKVARTLADLDDCETVSRIHLAEAISYRMASERLSQAA